MNLVSSHQGREVAIGKMKRSKSAEVIDAGNLSPAGSRWAGDNNRHGFNDSHRRCDVVFSRTDKQEDLWKRPSKHTLAQGTLHM